MIDKYKKFASITKNNGSMFFSDRPMFYWTMEIENVTPDYFPVNCILNLTSTALSFEVEDSDDFEIMLEHMKEHYSDIHPKEYPSIYGQGFDYKSRLAGFAACQLYSTQFCAIPIIELQGKDAESIITAISLIS